MIPTKNSLSFKQYIRLKPIKWGIKCVLLCESKTGYIVNAEVYTGKTNTDAVLLQCLGITGSLVARLCRPYADQNYCNFTDRFYSLVTLAEYMLNEQGTRMCRTAVTSRKLFPRQLCRRKWTKVLPKYCTMVLLPLWYGAITVRSILLRQNTSPMPTPPCSAMMPRSTRRFLLLAQQL